MQQLQRDWDRALQVGTKVYALSSLSTVSHLCSGCPANTNQHACGLRSSLFVARHTTTVLSVHRCTTDWFLLACRSGRKCSNHFATGSWGQRRCITTKQSSLMKQAAKLVAGAQAAWRNIVSMMRSSPGLKQRVRGTGYHQVQEISGYQLDASLLIDILVVVVLMPCRGQVFASLSIPDTIHKGTLQCVQTMIARCGTQ